MKKPFNPNDFFSALRVEDIVKKFPDLSSLDFNKVSLNEKLIELNYEIISKEYEDKKFKDIKDYYSFEVDEVV